MRFREMPSLTFLGSSGRGFCGTPVECTLSGLLVKSGEIGTVGAVLTGPRVLDPCSGDISSFAVQVDASRMGLDMTGRGGGFATVVGATSVFSGATRDFILLRTELSLLSRDGPAVPGVGTTGNGGALRRTGFRTLWPITDWQLLPVLWTGVILALLPTGSVLVGSVVGVSSFSFSMGVSEKPLKLPNKLTEGLAFPAGLRSESALSRLELMSSAAVNVCALV